jgi:hypothetical protein
VLGSRPTILSLHITGRRVEPPEPIYLGTMMPCTLVDEYCADNCNIAVSSMNKVIFFMVYGRDAKIPKNPPNTNY